jgi:hypothetical protein
MRTLPPRQPNANPRLQMFSLNDIDLVCSTKISVLIGVVEEFVDATDYVQVVEKFCHPPRYIPTINRHHERSRICLTSHSMSNNISFSPACPLWPATFNVEARLQLFRGILNPNCANYDRRQKQHINILAAIKARSGSGRGPQACNTTIVDPSVLW